MAKSKAVKKESPFWHPKRIGEFLEGKFIQFQSTKLPQRKGKPPETGLAMQLEGCLLIGIGTILATDLAPIYQKIKKGDKIKVQFTGEAPSNKGNPAKLFDIFWNGKQVEHQGAFGKPATKEALESFFPPADWSEPDKTK